jgi:glycerophosphoryl diester phosphodiesterase
MLETRRQFTGKISIVGHRGAADCAPENTLASFREGLRQGADIIELDVQLTVDGHVVAFHDERLERTTDGHGTLSSKTLTELRRLDAGGWFAPHFAGEKIPTLEEILVWARERVPLFVELKYGAAYDPALVEATVEQIVAHSMADQVMLISFEHGALRRARELAPDVATGALSVEPVPDPVALARGFAATAVMPVWHGVDAAYVARCHAAGLGVNVWGKEMDYRAMIAAGVDCVNADHPAQVRRDFMARREG